MFYSWTLHSSINTCIMQSRSSESKKLTRVKFILCRRQGTSKMSFMFHLYQIFLPLLNTRHGLIEQHVFSGTHESRRSGNSPSSRNILTCGHFATHVIEYYESVKSSYILGEKKKNSLHGPQYIIKINLCLSKRTVGRYSYVLLSINRRGKAELKFL